MKDHNPGLGWFYGRWRRIVARLDKEKIVSSVAKLKRNHPGETQEQLARRVARSAASISAVAGIAGASPALIPGVGLAISVVGIVPEEIYLTRRKCSMLLQIATIYGFDPSNPERLYEIIALIENSPRMIQTLMTAKDDVARLMTRAVVGLGRVPARGAVIGTKAASRGAVRFLPAIGLVASGAINYFAIRNLGRRAWAFYARLNAAEVKKLKAVNA
jgi:hypothetical protein